MSYNKEIHKAHFEVLIELLYSIKNNKISPSEVEEWLIKEINPEFIYTQEDTLLTDLYFTVLHFSFGEENISDSEFEYFKECIRGIRRHNLDEKNKFIKMHT